MTSSVGVAVAGDADLEGATEFRLGCGVFSSSSEDITCIIRDRVLRQISIGYGTTMNPPVFVQPPNESDTANNANWRI